MPGTTRISGRQLLGLGIVAISMGIVSTKFLRAAAENAEASRRNACQALAPNPLPALLQGREAPDFELPDASGKKWSLRSLRGQTVLLNFWATWCPPCVEEMPSMEDLARRIGDRAVILAVSVDKDWDAIKRHFGAHGTALSVLLDEEGNTPKLFGTEKYPESFLIDPTGKVRHFFVNKRDWGKAEAVLCLDSVR
jgi:peroxiredoxin